MSLPNQLRAYRMTNATIGNMIDDHMGSLEQAVADILGMDIDKVVSEAPLTHDCAGRITKLLRLVGAAGVGGIRIRDISNNSEFKITCNNGKLEIYLNTPDNEAVPAWVLKASLNLSGGGEWSTLKRATVGVKRTAAQTITTATETNISFDNEVWDGEPVGTHMFQIGTPTVVAVQSDGIYLVTYGVEWDMGAASVLNRCRIYNTVGLYYFAAALNEVPSATIPCGFSQHASQQVKLLAGDHLNLKVTQNSGGDMDVLNAHLEVSRLGDAP